MKIGIECVGPKKVPKITITSLVKPEHHNDIPPGPFYFCQQKECDTVYFDSQGHEIRKDQLAVGVWQKEDARDVPVCYCFDHTAADIMEDTRKNSPPTIPLSIRENIQAGMCECDIKNPQGSCCLGNVAYWVKQV